MFLNLKTFNAFLKFKHCKLESLEDALDLTTELVILGPSNPKMHLYHPYSWKYLKLFWKEEYYQYIVVTNGFPPALRVFTNVLTPPFKYLRPKGHLSVKNMDESLFLRETFEICFKITRATVAVLWELGFTIHPEKSVLVPAQQTMFLGFVIISLKMTINLTEERAKSIYTLCQNILSNY